MITKTDIQSLANLSRIEIDPQDIEGYVKDIDAILSYVDEIQGVSMSVDENVSEDKLSDGSLDKSRVDVIQRLRNLSHAPLTRTDIVLNAPSTYSQAILANAPKSRDGYVVVKKILSQE